MEPPVTGLYAAAGALLIVALAFNVARWRRGLRIGLGNGGDERLERAIRAHANAVETLPVALLVLLGLELAGYPEWALHAFGLPLVVARIAHARGLLRTAGHSAGRFWGTLVTWGVLVLGALALIGTYAVPAGTAGT